MVRAGREFSNWLVAGPPLKAKWVSPPTLPCDPPSQMLIAGHYASRQESCGSPGSDGPNNVAQRYGPYAQRNYNTHVIRPRLRQA